MHTFYAPALTAPGQRVTLDRDELQHVRVRRIRTGEAVRLVDGQGGFALGEFDGGEAVRVRSTGREAAAAVAIVVLQAALPSDTLDWAIEKAVEAGAHEIIVFNPVRSALGKRPSDRAERWARLVREACKQSGRARFPVVGHAASLVAALAAARCDRVWLADAAGDRPSFAGAPARAGLVVGPEGVLDDAEREAALAAGAARVTFGPWILRSETVAAVGVAMLQYGYGKPMATP